MFIAAWTDCNPRVQSLSLFTTYLHVHCSMNWLKPSSSVLVFVHYLSTCSLQHELIETLELSPCLCSLPIYMFIAAWTDWNPRAQSLSLFTTYLHVHCSMNWLKPSSSVLVFVHYLSTCSLQHELIETLELSLCLCSLPIYMFIAAWTDWNPRVQSLSLFTTYLHVHCNMNWLKPLSSVFVFVHYLSTCSLQHELIETLELSLCLCSLPIYMLIAAWTDWNPWAQSLSLFTTYLHVHCSMNWLKPSELSLCLCSLPIYMFIAAWTDCNPRAQSLPLFTTYLHVHCSMNWL